MDGQVKSPDVGNNQVYSADVRDDTLPNGGLASADIANNTVASGDIENGGLGGVDIANGDLNDEDLGLSFVNFAASIGVVPAHDCLPQDVTGIDVAGDHLLLTPEAGPAAETRLTYQAKYYPSAPAIRIVACNPTDSVQGGGVIDFNLLVIDAQ